MSVVGAFASNCSGDCLRNNKSHGIHYVMKGLTRQGVSASAYETAVSKEITVGN